MPPNPSTNFSWSYPADGVVSSWYNAFGIMADAMDTGVNTVELASFVVQSRMTAIESSAAARYTIVISAQSTNSPSIVGTTGGAAVWFTMSGAPIGAMVGSFAMISSGTNAFVQLRVSYGLDGSRGQTGVTNFAKIGFRATFVPAAGASVTIGDSIWVFKNQLVGTHVSHHWEAITSLGPGLYGVTVQANMFRATVSAPTIMVWDGLSYLHLSVLESRAANS